MAAAEEGEERLGASQRGAPEATAARLGREGFEPLSAGLGEAYREKARDLGGCPPIMTGRCPHAARFQLLSDCRQRGFAGALDLGNYRPSRGVGDRASPRGLMP